MESLTPLDKGDPVDITPVVFFTGDPDEKGQNRRLVTFATFDANSQNEIAEVSDWMSRYVSTFGYEVITNFDQQRPYFQGVPFGLDSIMVGNLNRSRLPEFFTIQNAQIVCDSFRSLFTREVNMNHIDVTLGDGTVIHGDFVVANSIKDSFNKTESSAISPDLKAQLKQLASEIGKISQLLPPEKAQQAAQDLSTLTTEATNKAPRKSWWELSMKGLADAAKSVGDIVKPILDIPAKLTALVPDLVISAKRGRLNSLWPIRLE